MWTSARFAWRPAATCLIAGGGNAVLLAPPRRDKLTGLLPAQVGVLRALNAGPATSLELAPDGRDGQVEALLCRLAEGGWLTVTVRRDDEDLYTIKPFAAPPPRRPVGTAEALSAFAIMRRDGGHFVLEHPLSWCDIELRSPRLPAFLARPGSDVAGLPDDVAEQLASDLAWGGFTVADPIREEREFGTRSWSPHELWFHRRSTLGDRVSSWDAFGPTKWAEGRFPPLPARRPPYPGEPVVLPAPDLAALRARDRGLTEVVEDRRSCRDFDEARPMSRDQLAELLYRSARTRDIRTENGIEFPSRPYPSGGGCYELELYPVVRRVTGLRAGMYHYDSVDHVLRPVVDADHPSVDRLLRTSALTLTDGGLPQVVIVIAARTGRLMWTYEQIPYALMLKHVGVLTQTLMLVATAMGLGSVAQGYSDTAAFVDAAKVAEVDECSLGSIVIGTEARDR